MDLAVVVDGNDSDDSTGVVVAGEQHRARPDTIRRNGISDGGPAQTAVVLGVQIS